MATSISAIGGSSYGGYPGPIINTSDSTYGNAFGTTATDATDFTDDAATSPLDEALAETTSTGVPLNPYDLNADGTVTPGEYQQALDEQEAASQLTNLPTTTFAALNGTADSDGDGISDLNDLTPEGGFTTSLNGLNANNGGFFGESFGPFNATSNAFQNSVLGNLASQTYGAVSAAAIDQSPRQQSLSVFA